MPEARLLRILIHLEAFATARGEATRLCEGCADLMAMTGAGIMVMSGGVAHGSVCSSNPGSTVMEDLQYTLGEGPCVEAYESDQPVIEPDLANPARPRWLAFSPPALDVGARAVFSFPMRIGPIRLGALSLYRDRAGPLDAEQFADGVVLAGVAARAVLAMQAEARPGALGPALEAGADHRSVVHQATGMVSAQLEIGVDDALACLRAHAFAASAALTTVARRVVNRELRFN